MLCYTLNKTHSESCIRSNTNDVPTQNAPWLIIKNTHRFFSVVLLGSTFSYHVHVPLCFITKWVMSTLYYTSRPCNFWSYVHLKHSMYFAPLLWIWRVLTNALWWSNWLKTQKLPNFNHFLELSNLLFEFWLLKDLYIIHFVCKCEWQRNVD